MYYLTDGMIAQAVPANETQSVPVNETQAVVEVPPQAAVPPQVPRQKPNALMSFLPFIAIFGLMYFFMIRPQKKKQKEHQQLLSMVKAGDRVMLTCGLFGTVTKVTEKTFFLELSNGTQAEFLLPAIAEVIRVDSEAK